MSNWEVNIEILIRKYILGTLTDSEAVFLSEWVKTSEQNARRFRTTVRYIEQMELLHTAESENFSRRVLNKEHKTKTLNKVKVMSRTHWKKMFITSLATAAAVVLGVVFTYNFIRNTSQETIDYTANVDYHATTQEYVSPADSTMHVILADGTSITLNQNSRLTLSAAYNLTERNVILDGEAYFEVAKSEKRFTVTAGNKRYIVHGTSFNILSYNEDKYSIVTLHTGKLEAEIDAQSYILKPGEELRVDDNTKSISKHTVQTEHSINWMNKRLTFARLPLKFVARQLEHKYNVKINMHPDIEDIPYTGELQDEDISTALHLLSITSPISMNIVERDNEFYISQKVQ